MKNSNLVYLFVIFIGISGCFSVLFGAWLAHGGQGLPELMQVRLAKALQYQFIHTVALFISLVWAMLQPSKLLVTSGLCFSVGILSFSGSIYVKTLFDFALIGNMAPLGGLSLALGWLFIGLAATYLINAKTNK